MSEHTMAYYAEKKRCAGVRQLFNFFFLRLNGWLVMITEMVTTISSGWMVFFIWFQLAARAQKALDDDRDQNSDKTRNFIRRIAPFRRNDTLCSRFVGSKSFSVIWNMTSSSSTPLKSGWNVEFLMFQWNMLLHKMCCIILRMMYSKKPREIFLLLRQNAIFRSKSAWNIRQHNPPTSCRLFANTSQSFMAGGCCFDWYVIHCMMGSWLRSYLTCAVIILVITGYNQRRNRKLSLENNQRIGKISSSGVCIAVATKSIMQ